MNESDNKSLFSRRRKYGYRLDRADYFVSKHIKKFLDKVLDEFVEDGCNVADIGCGEQPLRNKIERMGGHYTGIDIEQNSQGTVDVLSDIANIQRADSSFDLIICTEVLEHIYDVRSAFSEMSRLLKVGGNIILTTPFVYALHEEPTDFSRLTPHMIKKLATEQHLRISSIARAGNEIEVMATVWSKMFVQMGDPKKGIMFNWFIFPLLFAPCNLFATVVSFFFNRILPCKCFTSTLCVLNKVDL